MHQRVCWVSAAAILSPLHLGSTSSFVCCFISSHGENVPRALLGLSFPRAAARITASSWRHRHAAATRRRSQQRSHRAAAGARSLQQSRQTSCAARRRRRAQGGARQLRRGCVWDEGGGGGRLTLESAHGAPNRYCGTRPALLFLFLSLSLSLSLLSLSLAHTDDAPIVRRCHERRPPPTRQHVHVHTALVEQERDSLRVAADRGTAQCGVREHGLAAGRWCDAVLVDEELHNGRMSLFRGEDDRSPLISSNAV